MNPLLSTVCTPPRWLRLVLLLGVVVTPACRCNRPGLSPANPDLHVSPAALSFPSTFVGYPSHLELTLSNAGLASLSGSLETAPPFAVSTTSFSLVAGATVSVTVTFAPGLAGRFQGNFAVTPNGTSGGASTVAVPLDGVGVAPAHCASSDPCTTSTFSPDAAGCIAGTAPDGTSCSSGSSCLANAECFAGVCRGTPANCDDLDACTLDTCDASGVCQHFDISTQCPAPPDACHAAACDPDAGCLFVAVADGAPCGPTDCVTAQVCIGGSCTTLPVPDGYVCAPSSPCQPPGACRGGACQQPSARVLQPLWVYDPSPAQVVVGPRADGSGNAYWSEVDPDGGQWIASLTANGFFRYRFAEPIPNPWFFIEGDLVLLPGSTSYAYRTDGSGLGWQHDFAADADGGASFASLIASSPTQLFALYRSTDQDILTGAGIELSTGRTLWTRPLSSPLRGSYGFAIADEVGNVYVGIPDESPRRVVSVAADGTPRWQASGFDAPGATYGARLALWNDSTQRNAVLSCLSGAQISGFDNPALLDFAPISVLDGQIGYSVDFVDAGAAYGDCNDAPEFGPPAASVNWGLATGQVTRITETARWPLTPPILLANGGVLRLEQWQDCSDAGTRYRWTVREITASGESVFACELPAISDFADYDSPTPLGGDTWAIPVQGTGKMQAFALPGVQPARRGWMTQSGRASGAYRPQ